MEKRKHNPFQHIFEIIIFILLTFFVLILFLMIAWGLLTSLKENSDFRSNVLGFPEKWEFVNYLTVIKNFYVEVSKTVYSAGSMYIVQKRVELAELLLNTLIYSVGGSFLSALCPCLVAYCVAKYDKWFVSKVIYSTVLVIMIIPIVGNLPATLSVMQFLGIYDNIFGNLLTKFNFTNFYFLVFYGGYKAVAKDYTEAAYLDGASEWQTFFLIILPLVKNVFGTIMLIKFIEFWNDYTAVLVYLPTHPTLAYGIFIMSTTTITGLSTAPIRIAGAMILFVPTVIIFSFFQKRLLGNLSMGGVKE